MALLEPTDFNIVCAVLGGFIVLFGVVSVYIKERLFLSEALIALLFGLVLGPHGTDFIRPLSYAHGDPQRLDEITLAFSRLVLGVQLVLAGVQLPSGYIVKKWRSLAMLLGPVMVVEWIVSAAIVWAMIPGVEWVLALAIAACVAPTDPILVNHIVKGKFADAHIPVGLQNIITAESGANDGLGYPFLFIALYILRFQITGEGGGGDIVSLWFTETIGYVVLLSVVYGAVVGWLAKGLLHWAENRGFVDRESFLVFAIALALFIVGTCGMIGSDDVLACFIGGNVFTLDDWFRVETLDDSLQPTVDRLLNMTIFLWFGAVCPWTEILTLHDISVPRLALFGILIILFRRPPIVLALRPWIPDMENVRDGVVAGYFGPIGVSAVFYLLLTCSFLEDLGKAGEGMAVTVRACVWTCVVASVVVHGFTVPFIMLGNSLLGRNALGKSAEVGEDEEEAERGLLEAGAPGYGTLEC